LVVAGWAPRFSDFFSAVSIDMEAARHGQNLFNGNCVRCHGSYEKAWDRPAADQFRPEEILATVQVCSFSDTPVLDVGTDPPCAASMKSLLQLNDLAMSRRNAGESRNWDGQGYTQGDKLLQEWKNNPECRSISNRGGLSKQARAEECS
jgi:hypothetical protein